MIDCIVHVHVPSLGRCVDVIVELVRPGSDDLLQVIVAELPVIKVIVSGIDRIPLIRRSPLDHRSASYLSTRIFLPKSYVSSIGDAELNRQLIVEFRGGENSFLTIIIKAVEERVSRHQIIRRQLRFDIRFGNDSPNADVHSLSHEWNVEVKIDHRHVETKVTVVLQQLIAQKPVGRGEAVIESQKS